MFSNKLQLLSPTGVSSTPPNDITVSIVDAMRLVRMISIKNMNPPTFLSWAKEIYSYIETLPGKIVHIVFDNYATSDDSSISFSKGRTDSGIVRNISSLNQVLPQSNEWENFLTNRSNKLQTTRLLADYFTSDDIITEKQVFVT